MGRFSFTEAFLQFLDVWGVGNRSMFRTLRDLVLRPGYMIRDYLKGRYMAYFPPFQMLFLLVALSLLVMTGFNIGGRNLIKEQKTDWEKGIADSNKGALIEINSLPAESTSDEGIRTQEYFDTMNKFFSDAYNFVFSHMAATTLAWLLLLSGPLFLFFRHALAIKGIRFSEFFVAMTYCDNMMSIFIIVFAFFCFSGNIIPDTLISLLPIVALKQFSGYSYWQTTYRFLITYIFAFASFILMGALVAIVLAFYYNG